VRVFHTVRPELWIGTDDEANIGRGFVVRVLKRKIWTVKEALRHENLVGGEAGFKTLKVGEQVHLD
jgi:hypothetical protein